MLLPLLVTQFMIPRDTHHPHRIVPVCHLNFLRKGVRYMGQRHDGHLLCTCCPCERGRERLAWPKVLNVLRNLLMGMGGGGDKGMAWPEMHPKSPPNPHPDICPCETQIHHISVAAGHFNKQPRAATQKCEMPCPDRSGAASIQVVGGPHNSKVPQHCTPFGYPDTAGLWVPACKWPLWHQKMQKGGNQLWSSQQSHFRNGTGCFSKEFGILGSRVTNTNRIGVHLGQKWRGRNGGGGGELVWAQVGGGGSGRRT